jgi:hypothetical protein
LRSFCLALVSRQGERLRCHEASARGSGVVCGVRIPRVGPAAPGLIERIGQRLFGGLAMLSSQCSGNLGNALL